MSTTFKAVVYSHHRRQDGTYNVKIRVTHNRKSRNLPTETYITSDQMTRGMKIKDARVADAMDALIKKMRAAVTEIGFPATGMTVDQIVEEVRRRLESEARFSLDFYEYGVQYYVGLKPGTRKTYSSAFSRVLKYCDGRHPDVNEITARWLRGYLDHLIDAGIKPSSAALYLSKLSRVYNQAKKEYNDEDTGLIKIPGNPFANVETPTAVTDPRHQNISIERVQSIIDLPDDTRINSRRNLARDMFVLSFGLQGINLADLWEVKEGPAGFITFNRKKTRDKRFVEMCLRIEPEIRPYIDRYARGGYVLGVMREHYLNYDSFALAVNRGTKAMAETLGEKFKFYSARHSWATIARNDCGVDKWDVHEALTHTDSATRIDDVYIAPDYSRFWEANRAVLSLFRW